MKLINLTKPILAFLIFPFMAYEGVDRGMKYGAVDESRQQLMIISSVNNANGRTILPDYQATGTLPSGAVTTVTIFKREFQQLRPGQSIPVVEIPPQADSYITVSKLEESKPFIRMGPATFTWHLPVAAVGWLLLLAYLTKLWLIRQRE